MTPPDNEAAGRDAVTQFQLGRLLGRMDAMESRQIAHEALVKEAMGGINTKLDDLRTLTQQTQTRSAVSRSVWAWACVVAGALLSQVGSAIALHWFVR